MLCRISIIVTALIGAALSAAHADFLALAEGDRLEGRLVELADGIVVFETRLAGRHIVPADRVDYVTTEKIWRVTLQSGSAITGRFAEVDGKPFIDTLGEGGSVPVALSEIAGSEVLDEPETDQSARMPLRGSVGIAGVYRDGSRQYKNLRARLYLEMELKHVDLESDTVLEYSTAGRDDVPYGRSEMIARWMVEASTRPYLRLVWERDLNAAIDHEFQAGFGLEQQLFERDRHSIDGRIGLDLRHSAYEADRDRVLREALGRTPIPLVPSPRDLLENTRARDDTGIDLSGALSYRGEWFEKLEFEDELTLSIGLPEWDDFSARYRSRLLYPVGDRLKLKLEMGVDYTESPAYRYLDRWQSSIGAGVQVDF